MEKYSVSTGDNDVLLEKGNDKKDIKDMLSDAIKASEENREPAKEEKKISQKDHDFSR